MSPLIVIGLVLAPILFMSTFFIYKVVMKSSRLKATAIQNNKVILAVVFSVLNAPVLCMMGGHSAFVFPSPLSLAIVLDVVLPTASYFRYSGGWVSFIVMFIIVYLFKKNTERKSMDSKGSGSID